LTYYASRKILFILPTKLIEEQISAFTNFHYKTIKDKSEILKVWGAGRNWWGARSYCSYLPRIYKPTL